MNLIEKLTPGLINSYLDERSPSWKKILKLNV
jgi:hypothetical protein